MLHWLQNTHSSYQPSRSLVVVYGMEQIQFQTSLIRSQIDKSGIDANSKSEETPLRFNHYSDSRASLFPPTRSLDSLENYETTIPNPSIPSSFPPPNGQTSFFIPSHFPPARSPRQFRRLCNDNSKSFHTLLISASISTT